MEPRDAFKKVVHFANWEYEQKRPKTVKVLRLKSKSTITLGVLPEFQMRTIGPIIYLVVSDQGDELMIYFFNRNGNRTGGQHYEPTPQLLKKLHKSTIVKYQLPKKERKEFIDLTYKFQQEFPKIHQNIGKVLGITHKYPYTVLVDKNLQFSLTKMFGCKRTKKELHIPQEIKDKNYFEVLATVEWFYSYLTSTIPKPKEKPNITILYDLAILLSAVFNLNSQEKIALLKLIPEKIIIQDITFNLTEKVESSITSLVKAESQDTLINLLKKYLNIIKVLNRYRISLSLREFIEVFNHSCEIFNINNDVHILYISERKDIPSYFYFKIFSTVRELAKQLNLEPLKLKTYFLSMLFGLRILSRNEIMEPPYTLTEVIKNIGKFIKVPYIYENIGRIYTFVSDIISEYIFRYLECKIQYAIQKDTLDIILEIWNNSNYVLLNFEYELLWKPKNKIQLTKEENRIHSQDLHEKVKKNYLFTINKKGSINFSCQISFTNPVYQDKTIRKTILLQKIIMEA